jgi:hypothetical protein
MPYGSDASSRLTENPQVGAVTIAGKLGRHMRRRTPARAFKHRVHRALSRVGFASV